MVDVLGASAPIPARRSRLLPVLTGMIVLVGLSACSSGAAITSSAPAPLASALPVATVAPAITPSPPALQSSLAVSSPETASPTPMGSTKPIPSLSAKEFAQTFSASIAIFNLADAPLTIGGSIADTTTGKFTSFGTYAVGPSGQLAEAVVPGRYRLAFHLSSLTAAASCTLTVTDGAKYTFVAVPAAIAVELTGAPPTSSQDLLVATSSLCKG